MNDDALMGLGMFILITMIVGGFICTADRDNQRSAAIIAGCIEKGHAPEECKKAVE